MAFESYPQFILGLYISQGLQIKETLNLVSISVSGISTIYGFGDILAFHANRNMARAPFSYTVLGMLATAVDTLLRAFFMAYTLSIVKGFALLLLPIYFGVMLIGICLRKRSMSIDKKDLFGALMSFGCSAAESYAIHYNLRPISKIAFALIFVLSIALLSYTTAFMPDLGIHGEIANSTTLASLKTTDCLNYCEILKDSTSEVYCGSLWRYLDNGNSTDLNFSDFDAETFFTQTYGIILIVLLGLFILSTIEGLIEKFVSCSPYRVLRVHIW